MSKEDSITLEQMCDECYSTERWFGNNVFGVIINILIFGILFGPILWFITENERDRLEALTEEFNTAYTRAKRIRAITKDADDIKHELAKFESVKDLLLAKIEKIERRLEVNGHNHNWLIENKRDFDLAVEGITALKAKIKSAKV